MALTITTLGAFAVATDGESTGDAVTGYGAWNVGESDPFSHWFRTTTTGPDGVAANVRALDLLDVRGGWGAEAEE